MRRLLCSLTIAVVGLVTCALLAQPKSMGKKYAILVGVNEYSKPGYEALKYAERDMTRLKDELELAGFQVTLLLGSGKDDAEATVENIRKVLLEKTGVLKAVTQEDTVLVAFSGHGEQIDDKGKEAPYFCPKHAVTGDPETQISINEVLDNLDKRGGGSNLVLVDACRKYTKRVEGKKSGASMDRAKVQSLRDGIGVMFACSDRQEALEHKDAGDGHGLFFCGVLESLREAKAKGKDVTWERLVPEIRDKVKQLADQLDTTTPTDRRQRPQYIGNFTRDPVLVNAALVATPDEKTEEFDWKGEKRKRVVRTLNLGGEKMEFVQIPAGKFTMGSPASDKDAKDDEKPPHEVTFTKELWVAKYSVTKGQFAAFVKATKYDTEAETDDKGGWGYDAETKKFEQAKKYHWRNTGWSQTDQHPVVNVTWNDADKFCQWAAKEAKRGVRLLTETEYEYANRAGTTTRYFTGDDIASMEGYANVGDQSAKAKFPDWTVASFDDGYVFTSPVGKFKPNRFGLSDMTGNVWSWCADWYDAKAYGRGSVRDPKANSDSDQKYRILRGGSWSSYPGLCRVALRTWDAPDLRLNDNGFRVCFRMD